MCTIIYHSTAPVNARAAKAPAVGQADAGSELPHYFLRSHARQLLQGQHTLLRSKSLRPGRTAVARGGAWRAPPEKAKPADDPKAASPGQRRNRLLVRGHLSYKIRSGQPWS
ncbi:hypothetical protein MRX96_037553 [Rhipicephalus microplus]